MNKKALTAAIAGVLAAPMAAQAVEVKISGHVARALVVTDKAKSTRGTVKDSGSTGSRIRVTGEGETMDGGAAGVKLEYAAGSTLGLRYAEVWLSGSFGKVSIGQGDQGGEGSSGKDMSGVLGIGAGQETGGSEAINGNRKMADGSMSEMMYTYYDSFDGGGGRNERIRYDTPSLGPLSAAFSVGNGDQMSAGLNMSQTFGGSEISASVGTVQAPRGYSVISASAAAKLASGITISGAWGTMDLGDGPVEPTPNTHNYYQKKEDADFFQGKLGYIFGDTSIGVSWYQSSDLVNNGSELTVMGAGINHNLPKIGTNVFASAQNFDVEDKAIGKNEDDTVMMIGMRVKF